MHSFNTHVIYYSYEIEMGGHMSNRKKIITSYIFVTILGVLLHFTYEWSGENFFVGLFSAVNESTWEHLKLVFYPMVLLTLWQLWHSSDENAEFLAARTFGILAAMIFTVVVFYTYVGVLGRSIDFVNIIIYFLAVAFGFLVEQRVSGKTKLLDNKGSVVVLFLFALLFLVFTYAPPSLGIFQAP